MKKRIERIDKVGLDIMETEEKIATLKSKLAVLKEEEISLLNEKKIKLIDKFSIEEISLAMELFQEQSKEKTEQNVQQKENNLNENN